MNASPLNNTYTITDDVTILDKEYGITSLIRKDIEKAYILASNPKSGNIKKLEALVAQYPLIPHFRNYLSVLHSGLGNNADVMRIIEQTVQDHPNYLFGKVNLAKQNIHNEELDIVPTLLGKDLVLEKLYPQRNCFHISEIMAFYETAALYYLGKNDMDGAERAHFVLEEIAPETEVTYRIGDLIFDACMEDSNNDWDKQDESRIEPKIEALALSSTTQEAPIFLHKEIEALYQHDLSIDVQILQDILTLPRHSLIIDLELVLLDSIKRFNHFDIYDEENPEHTDFPIHALYLLGELKSDESLPIIFELLSQHDSYYDLYFDDWLGEDMWEPIYKLGKHKLDAFKEYMLAPNNYTYARTVIVKVLEQISVHQPQRKGEVVTWYSEVLDAYNNCSLEDEIIDSDLIALMACSIIDIAGVEGGECVKPLFDKNWVSIEICGTYDELIKSANIAIGIQKNELLSLEDRYANILSTWAGYDDFDDAEGDYFDDFIPHFPDEQQPIVNENKVGRNDPCPCGSGNKHKKCCLNK